MSSKLRRYDFPLTSHYHGKTRVRVLKVHREESGLHRVFEYSVQTTLFSELYSRVFTDERNEGLVATDTQKNTVYVVAKRTNAATPEQFGIDLAQHFLAQYPVLSAVQIEVKQTLWDRAQVDGDHDHGFVLNSPNHSKAVVYLARDASPDVTSSIVGMTVLKTTQSGFGNFLRDEYTLLPETDERCMATELTADWKYESTMQPDYEAVRKAVWEQLLYGFFGPAKGGVFSVSLQATIYDAGCLVLAAVPSVASISIFTPNLHYLPTVALERLGEKFEDDVFIPTNEPSGTIHCTVSRKSVPQSRL